MNQLPLGTVRALMIAAQGLHQNHQPRATKDAVRVIIRQMHALQIDTIHVIARSPYLVLWSRLGDYEPRWLDELLAERALFEYWSHAACFLPIEDYPLYRPRMLERSGDGGHARQWLNDHAAVAEVVLDCVRANGGVRSSDFERTDGEKGSWWNWKEEKIALEYLFYAGELMIARRHNFQRIYDLRERVLPNWDDTKVESDDAVVEQFVLNTVKALGVAKAEWVADYFRIGKPEANAALKNLEKQDRLMTVKVEGWKTPGYVHPDNLGLVKDAANGKLPRSKTTLLSPFDPLVWDRARALDLFGFDYKIECYTPAPKRKYGYFTLPILYNNALIGRLDPKAHRREGTFEVKSVHLEPDVVVDDALVAEVKAAIQACAVWHSTPRVVVRSANRPQLADRLSD
jgi:uncharacterized protein YcaQ